MKDTAVVAGTHDPPEEAEYIRLVASNTAGTTQGEGQFITNLVCRCGGRPPTPSTIHLPRTARIEDSQARFRVSCHGGETWCSGRLRLAARKMPRTGGPVEVVLLGEGSYELRAGTRKVVLIEYPSWSRHLLKRPPSQVRFVLIDPEGMRQVVEFTRVDF